MDHGISQDTVLREAKNFNEGCDIITYGPRIVSIDVSIDHGNDLLNIVTAPRKKYSLRLP